MPTGKRVAVITNAGGPGIMAADAAETLGLKMVTPSDKAKARLREFLPAAASVGNPVDVIGDAAPDLYINSLKVLQEDEDIDAIVVVVTPQNMTQPSVLAEKLAATHNGKKPVLATFMGGEAVEGREGNIDGRRHPELSRRRSARWTRCGPCAITPRGADARRASSPAFPVNRRRVDRIINRRFAAAQTQVGEVEAKDILRAYDFNVLDGQLARSADEAVEIAERIGYPVVLKISSPDIIHKSDFGGVRINLANAEQVRDAFDLMMLRIQRRAPDAHHPRRVRREDGHARTRGHPGHDARSAVRPDADVRLGRHLRRSDEGRDVPPRADHGGRGDADVEGHALLRAARRRARTGAAWISEAIADALQRISQLATDYPQITELDINPFIVGAVGTEAVRGRRAHDPFNRW